MIWEDIKGEILTFEDTEACAQELVKRDLYTTDFEDGLHLCEMYSLTTYKDYGLIKPEDTILIMKNDVYILPGGKRDDC